MPAVRLISANRQKQTYKAVVQSLLQQTITEPYLFCARPVLSAGGTAANLDVRQLMGYGAKCSREGASEVCERICVRGAEVQW